MTSKSNWIVFTLLMSSLASPRATLSNFLNGLFCFLFLHLRIMQIPTMRMMAEKMDTTIITTVLAELPLFPCVDGEDGGRRRRQEWLIQRVDFIIDLTTSCKQSCPYAAIRKVTLKPTEADITIERRHVGKTINKPIYCIRIRTFKLHISACRLPNRSPWCSLLSQSIQ